MNLFLSYSTKDHYKKCIFEASDLYYENFDGAVFRDCTFFDSSFSTNETLDSTASGVRFEN